MRHATEEDLETFLKQNVKVFERLQIDSSYYLKHWLNAWLKYCKKKNIDPRIK